MKVELSAGIPTRVTGSPEVVADLPGVSRIRASGPAGSIEEHRSELAKAEGELKRLDRTLRDIGYRVIGNPAG